jgi:hypothetical protein
MKMTIPFINCCLFLAASLTHCSTAPQNSPTKIRRYTLAGVSFSLSLKPPSCNRVVQGIALFPPPPHWGSLRSLKPSESSHQKFFSSIPTFCFWNKCSTSSSEKCWSVSRWGQPQISKYLSEQVKIDANLKGSG